MITAAELMQYLQITTTAWATSTAYKVGSYVTQSSVVYYCLIEHTSGTFNTDLTNLKWTTDSPVTKAVNYAIDKVNSYCNRDFRQATYTEEIYPLSSTRLFIKNWPIDPADGKITALKYLDESDGTWYDVIDSSTQALINSSTWRKNYEVRLLKGYTFYTNMLTRITYDNLMSSYAGLNDVKGCCLELAAMWYKESFAPGGGLLGKTSHNVGGQSDSGSSLAFEAKENKILSNLDQHRSNPV